jgi:hypothetical protein
MPNNPKKPRAVANTWTFTQVASTDEGSFTGWNIPMTRKHSPVTMADTPARRIRVAAVIFGLLSLLEIFPFVFIFLSPFEIIWISIN